MFLRACADVGLMWKVFLEFASVLLDNPEIRVTGSRYKILKHLLPLILNIMNCLFAIQLSVDKDGTMTDDGARCLPQAEMHALV